MPAPSSPPLRPVASARALLVRVAAVGALLASGCQQAAGPPALYEPATAEEARARFCEVVFDRATVERLSGAGHLEARASAGPSTPGVGECLWSSDAAAIELVTDCRPEHPRLAPTRDALRTRPGYREISIGSGGAYTRDQAGPVHRLVFVQDAPSCAVHVTTVRLEPDRTEALAGHVAAELAQQRDFVR